MKDHQLNTDVKNPKGVNNNDMKFVILKGLASLGYVMIEMKLLIT